MSLHAYRITKKKFAHTAFTGEGARLHGGRWNSKGIPLVYTAEHISLAVLEVMVGLEDTSLLPSYLIFELEFERRLVEFIEAGDLPRDWQSFPHPVSTQVIGDRWLAESRTAILGVPSSLIPAERNYLINPRHPDYPGISISDPQPFNLDPRLLRKR
jgi:RES domain-containing protein